MLRYGKTDGMDCVTGMRSRGMVKVACSKGKYMKGGVGGI